MHLEEHILFISLICQIVSILVSIWMHLEVRGKQFGETPKIVSILVSIWMHLEELRLVTLQLVPCSFNPSFYMDASGRVNAGRKASLRF